MNYRLLLAFLLFTPALCQDYYADIVIRVDNMQVNIDGITNHPELMSSNYSGFLTNSKGYYLLNISPQGNFSNYVYEIILPKEITINYIKTPNIMTMTYDYDNLIIKGLGTDEEFKAIVQYKLNSSNLMIYLGIILALVAFALIIYLKLYAKKSKANRINYSSLTDRQASIMRIIESKKEVEQRFLEKNLNMPKAAISRNVNAILRKGLIKKERKGVVNLLILAK